MSIILVWGRFASEVEAGSIHVTGEGTSQNAFQSDKTSRPDENRCPEDNNDTRSAKDAK
jgi:hypothetical protein